jgi:hypothetical protein
VVHVVGDCRLYFQDLTGVVFDGGAEDVDRSAQ